MRDGPADDAGESRVTGEDGHGRNIPCRARKDQPGGADGERGAAGSLGALVAACRGRWRLTGVSFRGVWCVCPGFEVSMRSGGLRRRAGGLRQTGGGRAACPGHRRGGTEGRKGAGRGARRTIHQLPESDRAWPLPVVLLRQAAARNSANGQLTFRRHDFIRVHLCASVVPILASCRRQNAGIVTTDAHRCTQMKSAVGE